MDTGTILQSAALLAAFGFSAIIYTEYRIKTMMPEPLTDIDERINQACINTMKATVALADQAKVDANTVLDHTMKMAHNRITLSNNRSAHIEHYLGMRANKFAQGERMWDFQQISKDLNVQRTAHKPLSIHNKQQQQRRARAA